MVCTLIYLTKVHIKAFALYSLLFHWKVLIELYKEEKLNGINLKIIDSSVSTVVQKRIAIRLVILFKIEGCFFPSILNVFIKK